MTLSMGTAEAFFWKKGGFRMGHCRRKRLRKSGVHIYMHHVIIPKKYAARVSYQPAPYLPQGTPQTRSWNKTPDS